jgi:hypothetical protein
METMKIRERLQLSQNREALRGNFWSDAANASGNSMARRMD